MSPLQEAWRGFDMASKKAKSRSMSANGRSSKSKFWTYSKLLHAITDHPDYISLDKTSRALLWDMYRQYNGYNNGNISAAHGVMGKWGWDKKTLLRCRKKLEAAGWIVVTRIPRAKKEPTLYAFSWLKIDSWQGKPYLDAGVENIPMKSLRPK
tara:strand:- start:299 stop:757 length:459 start_codon:yes stop_codon:yes gene_type:complete